MAREILINKNKSPFAFVRGFEPCLPDFLFVPCGNSLLLDGKFLAQEKILCSMSVFSVGLDKEFYLIHGNPELGFTPTLIEQNLKHKPRIWFLWAVGGGR